ncbi:hypothetical protein ACFV42_23370 [Streptomyces solisilvae]|uniref:hypothetical protein n=1 Tax=Streptomyces malaysiensis TaxID=92644 RepID=UPI0036ADE926
MLPELTFFLINEHHRNYRALSRAWSMADDSRRAAEQEATSTTNVVQDAEPP